ncbi:MAG: putative Ig domain-containing protein [Deltaproteobacteria bacterium]|nr:putative Ig domain-containing protein [Deltaproteobacteria bacterium]
MTRLSGLAPLTLLGALLAAPSAGAQTAPPYLRSISNQPYVAVSGGTPVPFNSRDDGEALVPIGFSFLYFNQAYTHLTVGTNGAISLSPACTTSTQCPGGSCAAAGFCLADIGVSAPDPAFPSTDVPQGMIGGLWDDLNFSARGDVTTQVVGTAPNRELVIQYDQAPHYDLFGSGASTQSNVSFQIRLSEADGGVAVHYGPYAAVSAETATWTWANGVEDETGTQGGVGDACATHNACTGTELAARTNTVIRWAPPNGPELAVRGVAPTGARPGDTITVDLTAENLGTTTATGTFFVDLYLASGRTVTSTDTQLGRLTFSDLASQASETQSVSAMIPAGSSPGRYIIGAIVDPTNVVAEALETNNVVHIQDPFLVGAELSVQVDLPPDTGPGETVDVTYRVLNAGSAHAAVGVEIFLSEDQLLDAGDVRILSSTVAVPAQPSTAFTTPVVLPNVQPRNYWVIAVVDRGNHIAEVDETNNVFVTADQLFLDGAELVAEEVRVDSPFAFRGQHLAVRGVISNQGRAAGRDFEYGIYLSTNTLCSTASDILLLEVDPVTVAAEGNLAFTVTATVPANAPVGPAYLCLIVNSRGRVLELRQTNNIARTLAPVAVRDPGPDFVVIRAEAPTSGAVGESLFVARTVVNAGNAADRAAYQVFLSEDIVLDPATDVLLGGGEVRLDPLTEDVGVDRLQVPAETAPGGYHLIYALDPDALVDELYEDNNLWISTATVGIEAADLVVATQSLPYGTVGVAYDVALAATGGVGAQVWAVTQGSLPAGLALEPATGRLHGSPEEAGAAELVISVSSADLQASRPFVLLVADPSAPLEILSQALPVGFAGRHYEYPLVAFGGVPPYVWSVSSNNALPNGFTLTAAGVVEGSAERPTLGGFTARVTDALGISADQALVLRIVEPRDAVRIADDVLPDGVVGEDYDEVITVATDTGEGPYSFELASGALPEGLTLAETGAVTGSPARVGVFTFEVRLSDARGDFDVNRYVVEIAEGAGITFLTNALPRALIDKPYLDEAGEAVSLRARSDSSTVAFAVVQGDLPDGLSMSEAGVISGTPTAQGTFSFVVVGRDAAGQQDLRAFGIVVDEPEVETPADPDDGCRCVADGGDRGLGLGWLALGLVGLLGRRRRARVGLVVGLLVAAPAVASAQAIPYFLDTRTETYAPRSGGAPLTFSDNDDGDAQVNLPFAFRFFDADYTSVYVGTNCVVRFGDRATSRFNTTTMPSTDDIETVIAPFWDDCIDPVVTTYEEGAAPSRVFIIQYAAVEHYDEPPGGQLAFQIHLYEGTGARFEVHYGPVTGMTDPSVWTASAGYEDPTGTIGGPLLPCNGGCNGNDFAAAQDLAVRVQQDAGLDVQALSVGVPERAFAGVDFPAPVTLRSLHANPIGPFSYEVRLLGAGEALPGRTVYTSGPITLAPYETLVDTALPVVPLGVASGRYRLAVVVDPTGDLAESDEANNVVLSGADFGLSPPQPDFVAAAVRPAATVAAPGDTLAVDVVVRNRGNLAGSTEWRLVLSHNAVVSVEDLELDRGTLNLDLLSTATVATQVTLPSDAAAGEYVLGLIVDADNATAEIDELNNIAAGAERLMISDAQLSIVTSGLPGGYVDIPYTHFLRAAGGDGRYTWSVASGTLPTGVLLNAATGELAGTPTEEANATFTVAVDSGGNQAAQALTISVVKAEGGLTIVTRALLPGTVGDAYPPVAPGTPEAEQPRLQVVGAQGAVTFTLESLAPAGLTLAADGRLFGTPRQAGNYVLEVVATDDVTEARRAISLTIAAPGRLTLVADILPDATLGQSYAYDLRVVGRSQTATVSFEADGGLPPGLLVSAAGSILGTPDHVGAFVFTVRVTEGSGVAAPVDTGSFRLVVREDGELEIGPTSLPAAIIGEDYEEELHATGGTGPLSWRVVGPSLPAGLTYEVAEVGQGQVLRFRGVATEEGLVSVLVRCTDAAGRQAELPVTLEARAAAPVIVPPPPKSGCTCADRPAAGAAWVLLGVLGLLGARSRWRR